MKEKLVEILLNEREKYVSGEKISELLGCSRTAVWKHIEELRKHGYEVEAVPRKGYRLMNSPNSIMPYNIKAYLTTKYIGQEITYYESVPSTQDVAHRLAHEGAKEGHVVIADEQTAGKGRLGRSWFSPSGTSISLSLIVRPNIPPQEAPQLTLLAAVSVVLGIEKTTPLKCDIKWPNDILCNGKKVVGILTEIQSDPDAIHSVIIGIGINANHKKEHFSSEIRQKATSLRIESGKEVNRAKLVANIFAEFEQLYELYLQKGFKEIKELWEKKAVNIGKSIVAKTLKGEIAGVAKGITDEGILLLEDENGRLYKIYSADIEIK